MGPLLGKGGLSHARRKGYLLTHTLKSSTLNIIPSGYWSGQQFQSDTREEREREREDGEGEDGEGREREITIKNTHIHIAI